ncbi:MAG TPA: M20 family metallopeptidase [Candidatus Acidoferrales bacterium]|nr:M20 family metallopeptidase [Candidatus Acidoferrales bacterium]
MSSVVASPAGAPDFVRRLRRELARRRPALLRRLGRFVRAESPSTDKAALDRFAELLAAECRAAGGEVRLVRQPRAGNHVLARFAARGGVRPILMLGHYDTVYPPGSLARMPFRVRAGRAFGPGAMDMKSGLVIGLAAIEALAALRVPLPAAVIFLTTSDEEVGSGTSRATIERLARGCRAAFVLEPAAGLRGDLKTARKGVGEVELVVRGRAAHAGLNPEEGVNAIHELALQIEQIRRFNDPAHGITVNAGIAEGGTRSNVIPDRARALVDVRVARAADGEELDRRFRSLQPVLPGAVLEIRGGINRPPMERSEAGVALYHRAKALAAALDLPLGEAAVGGGSDGNFTAALGVATLDGLGGVGHGAHSPGEFVLVRSLAERAALLALLLAATGGDAADSR